MNPNRSEFEKLTEDQVAKKVLRLPDGNIVPKHWGIFKVGEEIVIKNHVFEVIYIGKKDMRLRPIRPLEGKDDHKTA